MWEQVMNAGPALRSLKSFGAKTGDRPTEYKGYQQGIFLQL